MSLDKRLQFTSSYSVSLRLILILPVCLRAKWFHQILHVQFVIDEKKREQKNLSLRDLRFLQLFWWMFEASGIWHSVSLRNWLPNVSEEFCASTSVVHILNYLLTPWCRVLPEQLTGLQLVKKFPAFHGTRRFITALTSVSHLSTSLIRS